MFVEETQSSNGLGLGQGFVSRAQAMNLTTESSDKRLKVVLLLSPQTARCYFQALTSDVEIQQPDPRGVISTTHMCALHSQGRAVPEQSAFTQHH